MKPLDLPQAEVSEVATDFNEFATVRPLKLYEPHSGLIFKHFHSHAFIACVENAKVIGTGSLIVGDKLIAHGLSSGNYRKNIGIQLGKYLDIPEGESIDEECVLLWGSDNFGHWIFTYLTRLALLWYQPELLEKPLLVSSEVPKKYLEWLKLMGLDRLRFASDGPTVSRLWVPSVVMYRGHYEDQGVYLFPEAVHILRHVILKDLQLPRLPRTRLYISRQKSKWRRFVNDDELAGELERKSIKRVFLEDYPLEKQLDLVSRAEVIVIAAGGGSPITMFAPRDCTIVELSIPQFVGTFGSRVWTHILGQTFIRVDAKPLTKTGSLRIDWDAEIDVEKVMEAV